MWQLDHKEGWALKNWCFQTVVLERLLRAPWTARRSNQSILKEINPEYSLEGLMLKLKLQYFGHLMWRANPLEKILMLRCWERLRAGGEGSDRGWYGWMASLTRWTWVWASSRWWWRTESLEFCSPWLSYWRATNEIIRISCLNCMFMNLVQDSSGCTLQTPNFN